MYIDFMSSLHNKTKRDYLGRINEYPKAEAAKVAKQWGYDYWDGDRKFGYGGMKYDGRWRSVAEAMVKQYDLKAGDKVLDVGCGKGFGMYELAKLLPGIEVFGLDISTYAKEHAEPEVKDKIYIGSAESLPFESNSFDLVISINTLHNLPCYAMKKSLTEIMRVSRKHKYICVESWRNEEEKVNLLFWQLTCRGFFSVEEWEWWFEETGFDGDHSFIFFE